MARRINADASADLSPLASIFARRSGVIFPSGATSLRPAASILGAATLPETCAGPEALDALSIWSTEDLGMAYLSSPMSYSTRSPVSVSAQNPMPTPGVALYRSLRDSGLDLKNVYRVRDAAFDREDLHFALNEGWLIVGEQLEGHINCAFFVGDGEVLLIPPDLG